MTAILLSYPTLWLNHSLRESGLWVWLWWSETLLLAVTWLLVTAATILTLRRRGRRRFLDIALPGLALLTLAIAWPLHGSAPTSAMALLGGMLLATGLWVNLRDSRTPEGSARSD